MQMNRRGDAIRFFACLDILLGSHHGSAIESAGDPGKGIVIEGFRRAIADHHRTDVFLMRPFPRPGEVNFSLFPVSSRSLVRPLQVFQLPGEEVVGRAGFEPA